MIDEYNWISGRQPIFTIHKINPIFALIHDLHENEMRLCFDQFYNR